LETEPYDSLIHFLLLQIGRFSAGIIVGFVVLLLLLVISALVSGSEVAFFSLSPKQLNKIKNVKSKSNQNIVRLLQSSDRLLATILITNNFVNVGIVILATFLSGILFNLYINPLLTFLIEVVVITFLILFFSEIMPKIYANKHPYLFARFTAPGLIVLEKIFWPVSSFLIFSTSIVQKRFASKKRNISIDELSDALELTESNITEDKKILKGIVKFGNLDVSEIMRSRVDVIAADINTKFKELMGIINASGYSRIPIYEDTFDKVKGILYIKDLLPHLHKPDSFKWQSLIRSSYYVPETKKINDLLKEFQVNRIHMAIVIDEYGGSSGIITLEDILEEIVGEIVDESDDEKMPYKKIDESTYLFEGKILLHDFYRALNIDEHIFDEIKGEADTLAGLLLEMREDMPEKDDKISYKNFVFEVVAVDKRRIKEIKVITLVAK
jgi:putative hemolysin